MCNVSVATLDAIQLNQGSGIWSQTAGPGVSLSGNKSNIVNERNKKLSEYVPKGGDLSAMLLNNTAMGSCMFKKKDWFFVGGYDESMRSGFEDWEYYIRLLSTGGSVYVIQELLFSYRKGIESTSTRANKIKYNLLKYIYQKNEEIYKQYFNDFIAFSQARMHVIRPSPATWMTSLSTFYYAYTHP